MIEREQYMEVSDRKKSDTLYTEVIERIAIYMMVIKRIVTYGGCTVVAIYLLAEQQGYKLYHLGQWSYQ